MSRDLQHHQYQEHLRQAVHLRAHRIHCRVWVAGCLRVEIVTGIRILTLSSTSLPMYTIDDLNGRGVGYKRNLLLCTLRGRSSVLQRNSQTQSKSWRIECPLHLQSSAFLVDTFRRLKIESDRRLLLPLDQGLHSPSLVMKEMNSLTHSCMHSFASFAILAFSGKAVFMIRATGAKFLILASEVRL